MENEKLRAIIVSSILEYAARYQVSRYKALCDVSSSTFNYMVGWAKKKGKTVFTDYTEYKERFFDFVLGDDSALTDVELYYIGWHYSKTPEAEPPAANVLEELKKAVTEHRTEIKRLTDATEEMRKIIYKARLGSIFERITDFVSYHNNVCNNGEMIFYAELYQLGLIDGIRQERKRRKKELSQSA